jgi:hypothetical protein
VTSDSNRVAGRHYPWDPSRPPNLRRMMELADGAQVATSRPERLCVWAEEGVGPNHLFYVLKQPLGRPWLDERVVEEVVLYLQVEQRRHDEWAKEVVFVGRM